MVIISAGALAAIAFFQFLVSATPAAESLLSIAFIALVSLPTLYIFSYRPVSSLLERHRVAADSAAKLQSRLMRLAFHDSLTQLPNSSPSPNRPGS